MKRKVVEQRRQKRAVSEGNSKYAKKIQQQKRGNFSINSPFRLIESSYGVSIAEFFKMRFTLSRD